MNPQEADNLIQQVLAGDIAAYGRLVDAQQGRLTSFFVGRCPPGAEAEDLVQETFVTAYRRLEHYEPQGRLGAWLHGIARNILRDAWKSSRRRIRLSSIDEAVLDAVLAAPETDASDEIDALQHCMQGLSENLRRLLAAVHVEGQRIQAMAEEVGKTPEAIRMTLHRVRVRLRECVQRRLQTETA